MTQSPPVGIGIVGLGEVSASHVAGYGNLPGRARIIALCDINERRLAGRAAALGVPTFRDYRQLLAEPSVDAVVLLLPHLLHHSIALAALEAGKHVAIEKPMAATHAECLELIAAAEARSLILAVSENSRFVESYIEAKRLIEEGWFGRIRLVRAFIYGSALRELAAPGDEWKRREGGFAAILDAAPHFFYIFKWMFGPVSSLQAVPRCWAMNHGLPECEVEDGACITGLLTAGGSFSIEVALNVEIPWGERFEIYGDEGSMICDQLADPPVRLHKDAHDYGTPLQTVRGDPRGWRDLSIRRGAADFVRAVREGSAPGVNALDAAYAVKLAECAYRSVRSGGTAVAVL